MKEHSVIQFRRPEQVHDALSALVREGVQRLIAQAEQAELGEFSVPKRWAHGCAGPRRGGA